MTTLSKTVLTLLFVIIIAFVFSFPKKQHPVIVNNTTVGNTSTTTEQSPEETEAIRNKPFPLAGMDGLNGNGSSTVTSSPPKIVGIIVGSVLLGPVCPVMRDPPDPACADKPFKTNLVLLTKGTNKVVKEFSSNETGKFTLEVKPGEYMIQNAQASAMLPRCSSANIIRVSAGIRTLVDVSCDSGIR